MKRILMVGSARESAGGVSSVIRLMERFSCFRGGEYQMYWLGTQIQRNYLWKLWYALRGSVVALLIMWRYDIVHIHTTPDKLGLLIQLPVLLWAKCMRRKVIIQLHVGNQLKTKKNTLFVWTLQRADLIVLLAKKWERLFAEWYPEVKAQTTVLYNACERVERVSTDEKEKVIMMAAWFNDNKGTDVLLNALSLMLSRRGAVKTADGQFDAGALDGWKVMMLGNGEVERFREMADGLGLSRIVTFTGYVTGQTREDYFRKASIYCMCSYEEGFPMVVLESWMYGICVVTTPVGGLPDVIEEGRNSLTFDFGDSEGLASQLERLMADDRLRRQMAEYSREFVETRFSMEIIGEEMGKMYLRLC